MKKLLLIFVLLAVLLAGCERPTTIVPAVSVDLPGGE